MLKEIVRLAFEFLLWLAFHTVRAWTSECMRAQQYKKIISVKTTQKQVVKKFSRLLTQLISFVIFLFSRKPFSEWNLISLLLLLDGISLERKIWILGDDKNLNVTCFFKIEIIILIQNSRVIFPTEHNMQASNRHVGRCFRQRLGSSLGVCVSRRSQRWSFSAAVAFASCSMLEHPRVGTTNRHPQGWHGLHFDPDSPWTRSSRRKDTHSWGRWKYGNLKVYSRIERF